MEFWLHFIFAINYFLDTFDFFAYKLGNFSLIFKTSLILLMEDNACIYNFFWYFFPFDYSFFLKYFEISLIFLGNFARMEEGSLLKVVGLLVLLPLLLLEVLTPLIFGVETLFLKEALLLSVISKSYPNS